MVQQTTSPVAGARAQREVRQRLAAGIVAGPIFVGLCAVQAFTRDGFRPTYHPLSLLSLGSMGWVQIASFVVTGGLCLVFASGLRASLAPGVGRGWVPRLVALMGVGLVLAGVFTTDAGAGFPAGTPDGPAPAISWHAALHEVGYLVTTISWVALTIVLFRRWRAAAGEPGRARLALAALGAVVVVSAWPDLDTLALRLVIATAIQFALLTVLAVTERKK